MEKLNPLNIAKFVLNHYRARGLEGCAPTPAEFEFGLKLIGSSLKACSVSFKIADKVNLDFPCQHGWRAVVATAAIDGIPIPAMSSALSFYDGFRLENLPANMLQAQRDYFGAHTYELLSAPGKFVHTNWTGKGGTTASSTYQA